MLHVPFTLLRRILLTSTLLTFPLSLTAQHTTTQQHNSGMLLLLFLQAALCHSHMCSALLWWHDKDATQNTLAVA